MSEVEDWEVGNYINEFLNACDADNPLKIVGTAKRLRSLYYKLSPDQKIEMIERIWPLLENPSAHIRQCAACIMEESEINSRSCMPKDGWRIKIKREDGSIFIKRWRNTMSAEDGFKHHMDWENFIDRHQKAMAEKNAWRESL